MFFPAFPVPPWKIFQFHQPLKTWIPALFGCAEFCFAKPAFGCPAAFGLPAGMTG
jgi:hypothetical protein